MELKERLMKEFEIKEPGRLKYFLGIEVAYSKQGIFISQQKYVTNLLVETGKSGFKPVSTPIDQNYKLGEAKETPTVDKKMYQRLVGRLIYLAHTLLDIAYSASVINQFMREMTGNPEKGILFKKSEALTFEAYTVADYAGSKLDYRSTSGYCTFLGGNLVT